MARRGVVAAGHPLTAEAAAEVLRAGGNAFDAAIAGFFAACVAEPVLASPGGGGFLLAHSDRGDTVYDFFAHTPRHKRPAHEVDFYPIHADFGAVRQEFHVGLGSVATPGCIKGMFAVHRDLGSIPMPELVAPALEHARRGLVLNDFQAYLLQVIAPILTATPASRALFGGGSGPDALAQAGETLRFGELADVLEVLSREGERLFYEGEIAALIGSLCEDGGHLQKQDLALYQVQRRQPLRVAYRNHRLLTNPPPSSGGLLMGFALKLLESVPLAAHSFGSYPHLALLVEAMAQTNLARVDDYAQRGTGILDEDYLAMYRDHIRGRAQALRGTTHLSVMDRHGRCAALTTSNGEGCGHLIPGTGIMLNNMLGEEDLNPEGFHRWGCDQRMTSMMAPSILFDSGGSRVVLGSGGSNRIRTALLQVVSNLVDFAMPLEQAVAAPRLHFEKGRLGIEGGWDQRILQRLVEQYPEHHLWPDLNLFFGGVHAVSDLGNSCRGAGDPRRSGAVATDAGG